MSTWLTIFAATPFALFTILFWRKVKLIWISLITMISIILIAVILWQIQPIYLFASLGKGFFVALDIFFIILGAVFFLETLKKIGVVENLGIHLRLISSDIRVQVILLAWFFENFLEGIAGFGTPATIVAPLLIGLGISPINAVIISLLGNSAAGVFGAAGTPIKTGFGELAGAEVALKASIYNLVGILIPVFMVWFVTKNIVNRKKYFLEIIPFALVAGAAFAIPSIFTVFLGQEFPTILGSVVGLIIILLMIKANILVPKNKLTFKGIEDKMANMSLWKVVLPYLLLIFLLIFGKMLLGKMGFSISIMIKHTFSYFNPGLILIFAGAIVTLFYKISARSYINSLKISFNKSIAPFLVIIFMSSIAQIMVHSSNNASGFPSMVDSLSLVIKNRFLPLISPFIGAFGSFLTGSVTVSNLMFGNFIARAAGEIGFNVESVLALTVVGGAFGNMIALADILVAEVVVGIKHKEKGVIVNVIVPCLVCLLLVGVIGLLIFG